MQVLKKIFLEGKTKPRDPTAFQGVWKTAILLAACSSVLCNPARAQDAKPLTPKELCERLRVRNEVLLFDPSGQVIQRVLTGQREIEMPVPIGTITNSSTGPADRDPKGEETEWETIGGKRAKRLCRMRNQWESDWGEGLSFVVTQQFSVDESGRIIAHLIRYAQPGEWRDGEKQDPTQKLEEIHTVVTDLAPVQFSWKQGNGRVVARFSAYLKEVEENIEVSQLPLAAVDAVMYTDSGDLLARNVTFTGRYVALRTKGGTVALSFFPIPGSKQSGDVNGSRVRFSAEGIGNVTLKSSENILPAGMKGKVYVLSLPDIRSGSLNSLGVSTTSSAEKLLERIRERASN